MKKGSSGCYGTTTEPPCKLEDNDPLLEPVCRRNIFLQVKPRLCAQLTHRSTTLDLALHGGKQVAVEVVVAATQMNLLTEKMRRLDVSVDRTKNQSPTICLSSD